MIAFVILLIFLSATFSGLTIGMFSLGLSDLERKIKMGSKKAERIYKVRKNGNFLLMHSVGSIPHGTEIDVPLNYADYYFLEALKRKRDIEEGTH